MAVPGTAMKGKLCEPLTYNIDLSYQRPPSVTKVDQGSGPPAPNLTSYSNIKLVAIMYKNSSDFHLEF